ncbi:MAG: response regulator [Candidatus Solibacter sp.]
MPNRRDGGGVLPSSRLAPFLLPLLFTIVAASIGGVTWRFYVEQKEVSDRALHAQLITTLEGKIRQIVEWRRERRGQARIISTGTFAVNTLRRAIGGRASPAEVAVLQERLRSICANLRYAGAVLVDADGKVILWEGRKFGDQEHLRRVMRQVIEAADTVERDFDVGERTHLPHTAINIPLRDGPGQPIFGGLLLSIDANEYLEPLLSWPLPTRTGEALLVRREEDAVLFLTGTRGNPQAALRQRVPLERPNAVEVLATDGRTGVVTGVDYRGVPVHAAMRAVPDTPWFLIAKIDEWEATEPLRRRSLLLGVTALSLILLSAGLLWFLWRREQLAQYQSRLEAEAAHRRMSDQYSSLSRLANDVILLMDPNGVILTANDSVARVYGFQPGEIQGRHVRELRASGSEATFARQWDLARECGSLVFETVHRRRDGSEFPVEVSTRTVPMDGQMLQQSILRDVSDRKHAERELSESETRFRQLVEGAPYGILVVEETRILYANPEALRLFGASAKVGLAGQSLLDRVPAEDREELALRLGAVAAELQPKAVERGYLRIDGHPFWAGVSATRIIYSGRPAALLFLSDITARRAADEDRARLEEQLRHAQKLESVGRLAGGVAHDFNNYLTVINGYCDMLLSGELPDDEIRESLSEVRAAGERAASVTQQLLTFSRKQIAEPRVVDLNQVVRDSEQLLRRLIGEDVRMVSRVHAHASYVLADPSQLGQVLMNLVINSRDAMPGGGSITIEISEKEIGSADETRRDRAPGRYAVLSVADTGLGIDRKTLARIFEPFFTTKSVGTGTGLGLSTAYGIVRQAGGWIDVQSAPGAGARFDVWLPLTQAEAPALPAPATAGGAARGHETLLIVEDQADVRRLTLSILRAAGYRLLEAASGEAALRVSAEHAGRIDLLVTDVIMPGLNGRQLAERLVAQRPDLRVLYTSGYASEVIARQGSLDPGLEYLRKPFGAPELNAKVRQVLERATVSQRRILIIDDDPAVRGLLHRILTGAGYAVVEAADGKSGLLEVEHAPMDLVITDLVMPEQEGLEVLGKLHARRPGLPVIAISGAFGGSFLEVARHLGAAAALPKPVEATTLLEAVRKAIS